MSSWSLTTESPEETRELGYLLGQLLPSPGLVLLGGDLGSGKTCMTQGLAQGIGVPADEPVTSPSYTLMNQYHGRCPLYHFDLYRLSGPEDLIDLGFEEYLEGEGITIVEWADRALEMTEESLQIRINHAGGNRRVICLEAQGWPYHLLLEQFKRNWQERERT